MSKPSFFNAIKSTCEPMSPVECFHSHSYPMYPVECCTYIHIQMYPIACYDDATFKVILTQATNCRSSKIYNFNADKPMSPQVCYAALAQASLILVLVVSLEGRTISTQRSFSCVDDNFPIVLQMQTRGFPSQAGTSPWLVGPLNTVVQRLPWRVYAPNLNQLLLFPLRQIKLGAQDV